MPLWKKINKPSKIPDKEYSRQAHYPHSSNHIQLLSMLASHTEIKFQFFLRICSFWYQNRQILLIPHPHSVFRIHRLASHHLNLYHTSSIHNYLSNTLNDTKIYQATYIFTPSPKHLKDISLTNLLSLFLNIKALLSRAHSLYLWFAKNKCSWQWCWIPLLYLRPG